MNIEEADGPGPAAQIIVGAAEGHLDTLVAKPVRD